MNEPKKISAGTSVSWSFGHELADGQWQFNYALRGQGAIDIDTAAADGLVTVSKLADVTAAWIPGLYDWRLYASNGADRQLIASGQMEIEADFASLTALGTIPAVTPSECWMRLIRCSRAGFFPIMRVTPLTTAA